MKSTTACDDSLLVWLSMASKVSVALLYTFHELAPGTSESTLALGRSLLAFCVESAANCLDAVTLMS